MKFLNVLPFKVRRSLSMVAIIVASIMLIAASCSEIEPTPTREVELIFDDDNADKILTFETLQNYANDEKVKTIYLVPTGHWSGLRAFNITYFRNNLEPRLNISPKIRGRGDFDFALGEASKVPADSLWFVQQGWTINKRFQ